MNKILFFLFFLYSASSCSNNTALNNGMEILSETPDPCECLEAANIAIKDKDELTVRQSQILALYCLPGAMEQQFVDLDKPYSYAVKEMQKYIQENCPEYSQKSPD